jgi:hypothetical protein
MTHRLFTPLLLSAAALSVTGFAHAAPTGALLEPPPTKGEPLPTDPPIVRPTLPPRPTCSAPTLAQCQDTTYLASYCGTVNKAACGALVAPLYRNEISAIGQTTQILKNNGSGDRLTLAKQLTPNAQQERKYTFGTFSFTTAAQFGRIRPPSSAVADITPQHPDYEASGAAVSSCQEYAYESLYDHERWAEAAETCGSNAECVYALSLRSDTPTLKTTMLKKNGTAAVVQPVRPGPYTTLKNVFFVQYITELRNHPDYAASAAFRSKADAIIAQVQGTPKVTAPSELDWHRTMHDRWYSSYVAPAEVTSIEQRLETYDAAESGIGVANFAIPLLEAVIPGQPSPYREQSEALLAEYRASKARAIADMARLAFAEWDHVSTIDGVTLDRGCFNRSASNRCDWQPKKFLQRYAGHYTAKTEELFNACVEATAGNFSKVPAAYRVDSDALQTWIAAQSLPKLGTEIVGERLNDGQDWGDHDWFAAGYSYDAGWQLAAERQSGTNRICKLKGGAYASGNATAWALGQPIEVLDTRHKLSVREVGDQIQIHSHLRFMGEDVYTPIDVNVVAPSATPVNRDYQKTLAQRTYTKWLTIAGVGIKLQAHAELKAGANVNAHANAAQGCNPDNLAYDAGISVTPWINVHVVPEVSVGIGLIQGGVRGDVDLLKVSAPATGSVKLVGGVNDITLQLRARADLGLNLLKGNIDVFLESCVPYVGCADLASKELYAWDGYAWNVPLFNYTKDVKINVFDAATKPQSLTGGYTFNPGVIGMAMSP